MTFIDSLSLPKFPFRVFLQRFQQIHEPFVETVQFPGSAGVIPAIEPPLTGRHVLQQGNVNESAGRIDPPGTTGTFYHDSFRRYPHRRVHIAISLSFPDRPFDLFAFEDV
jgi:hypothetical protein